MYSYCLDELGVRKLVTEEDLDREQLLSIRRLLTSLGSFTSGGSLAETVSSVAGPLTLT